MEENNIFEPVNTPETPSQPQSDGLFTQPAQDPNKKPIHVASLVLGILSIIIGLLIPLPAYILGGAGLSMANKNKETHSTTAAKVCSIIGIIIAAILHIMGIIYIM